MSSQPYQFIVYSLLVLLSSALCLFLPPLCLLRLLLTLYPGLTFQLLAGLPPLDSLGMKRGNKQIEITNCLEGSFLWTVYTSCEQCALDFVPVTD